MSAELNELHIQLYLLTIISRVVFLYVRGQRANVLDQRVSCVTTFSRSLEGLKW